VRGILDALLLQVCCVMWLLLVYHVCFLLLSQSCSC
jgi:hypothetical protein